MATPPLAELAQAHQRSRIRLARAATLQALGMLRATNLDHLDASWNVIAPPLVTAVTAAQTAAAQQSIGYMADTATLLGSGPAPDRITPSAFAGVTIDGREVGPAMYGSITTTKTLIGEGLPAARSFEAGAAFLATIVQSAIADAGRQADRVQATGHRYIQYVRVVQAGACSRCAILAGKAEYSQAFLRHPNCHCTSVPLLTESSPIPRGLFGSPDEYFHSLDPAEQNRVFTNAGAQAIRDGANPISVVNARRGASKEVGHGLVEKRFGMSAPLGYDTNGNPIKVFTTGEGTTYRGEFGKAQHAAKNGANRFQTTTNYRLMPETIYGIAGGDQAKAIDLLKRYGYLN